VAPFHRGFDAQYGLDPEGHVALGLSSDTSVVEPGSSGTLHATARDGRQRRHVGVDGRHPVRYRRFSFRSFVQKERRRDGR
jgi:hypothetical protein